MFSASSSQKSNRPYQNQPKNAKSAPTIIRPYSLQPNTNTNSNSNFGLASTIPKNSSIPSSKYSSSRQKNLSNSNKPSENYYYSGPAGPINVGNKSRQSNNHMNLSTPNLNASAVPVAATTPAGAPAATNYSHLPHYQKEIAIWLKKHRLHKYNEIIFNYNYEDLLNINLMENLTQKELTNKNMTVGGRDKIINICNKLNERVKNLEEDFSGFYA